MNVNKIQRLSKQHKLLKDFHKTCRGTSIELSVHDRSSYTDQFDRTLDSDTTASIIAEVRGILLVRISVIEEEIRAEASNGERK